MRKIITRTIALASVLILLEIFRNRVVKYRKVELPAKESWDAPEGYRLSVLHVSDIHLTAKNLRLLEPLEKLGDRLWDFVLVTGDLIDDDSGIEPVCEVIGRLKARYGKFSVLGNHDYLCYQGRNPVEWFKVVTHPIFGFDCNRFCRANDVKRLAEKLADSGIRLLCNEVAEGKLENGTPWQIFGIDDPASDRDRPQILYPCVADSALRIVLTHSPVRLESLRPFDAEIVLCGHTHGGQIRLPLFGSLTTHSDADRKMSAGLVDLGGCRVYISRGMGEGRALPIRFLSPPELTEIVIFKPDNKCLSP